MEWNILNKREKNSLNGCWSEVESVVVKCEMSARGVDEPRVRLANGLIVPPPATDF